MTNRFSEVAGDVVKGATNLFIGMALLIVFLVVAVLTLGGIVVHEWYQDSQEEVTDGASQTGP